MTGVSCLYRRPSGIYVARLAVPIRLRPFVGRGEIHVSTHVRELGAAKLAAHQILAHWRQRFMALDIERLASSQPLLQGDGMISLPLAASATGLSEASLLNEIRTSRASLAMQAANWRGLRVADWGDIETDFDGSFVLNDVEARGDPQLLSEVVRLFDSATTINAILTSGVSSESWFLLQGSSAFRTNEPIEISSSALLVGKQIIETIRSAILTSALQSGSHRATAPIKAISPELITPPPSNRKRISEVFAIYEKRSSWAEQQSRRMRTEVGYFVDLMSDPFVDEIDLSTIDEYATLLARLPTDIYQTRRRFLENPSLRRLIEIAQSDGLALKTDATVKRHIGTLGEVLNFAVEPGGWLKFNPARRYKRGKEAHKSRPQDSRNEFSPDELECIFSQSWFQSGLGEFRENGVTNFRPYHFWIPLLALTSGGRVNELSQLYLDDLRCSASGSWFLDFNLTQPDKLDEPDKKLKNINSTRIVPLHDVVLKAGLIEYAQCLRDMGHTRLFPELKRDRLKGYGKPASTWFNEKFLGKQLRWNRDGTRVMHSFRHNFTTAVERLDLPERVMAQLLGHQRGETEGANRYAKDRNVDLLKPVLDRLTWPCLDHTGHFDVSAGLKAIAYALRRKEAIARSKANRKV